MIAVTFDTLNSSKRLEKAGFTREQAEALASEQAKLIEDGLATKNDLKELELRLKLWTVGQAVIIISVLAAIKFFG